MNPQFVVNMQSPARKTSETKFSSESREYGLTRPVSRRSSMKPSARRAAGLSQTIRPPRSTSVPPNAPTSHVNSQVSTSCARQESKIGYFTIPASRALRAMRVELFQRPRRRSGPDPPQVVHVGIQHLEIDMEGQRPQAVAVIERRVDLRHDPVPDAPVQAGGELIDDTLLREICYPDEVDEDEVEVGKGFRGGFEDEVVPVLVLDEIAAHPDACFLPEGFPPLDDVSQVVPGLFHVEKPYLLAGKRHYRHGDEEGDREQNFH